MAELRKYMLGEATKGVVAACVGAALWHFGQAWVDGEPEYKLFSRNAYLSAPLGEQGLKMEVGGKALANVSIVEFQIANRTPKQIPDLTLLFTEEKGGPALVSSGLMSPGSLPASEMVEEIATSDPLSRKFHLKFLPRQHDGDYLDAVFVFEGEKAPHMSISSISGDVAIVPYQQWKDSLLGVVYAGAIICVAMAIQLFLMSFVEYFREPKTHKRSVEKFMVFAESRRHEGKLASKDSFTTGDAREIYAEYIRPKPSRFWSKIFPRRDFEY